LKKTTTKDKNKKMKHLILLVLIGLMLMGVSSTNEQEFAARVVAEINRRMEIAHHGEPLLVNAIHHESYGHARLVDAKV
jgi:hypothetical protein